MRPRQRHRWQVRCIPRKHQWFHGRSIPLHRPPLVHHDAMLLSLHFRFHFRCSVRIPAAFNGVWGHKPTGGLVSNAGQYPTSPLPVMVTGPITRYSDDLLPLLEILRGPDGVDPSCLHMVLVEVDLPLAAPIAEGATAALRPAQGGASDTPAARHLNVGKRQIVAPSTSQEGSATPSDLSSLLVRPGVSPSGAQARSRGRAGSTGSQLLSSQGNTGAPDASPSPPPLQQAAGGATRGVLSLPEPNSPPYSRSRTGSGAAGLNAGMGALEADLGSPDSGTLLLIDRTCAPSTQDTSPQIGSGAFTATQQTEATGITAAALKGDTAVGLASHTGAAAAGEDSVGAESQGLVDGTMSSSFAAGAVPAVSKPEEASSAAGSPATAAAAAAATALQPLHPSAVGLRHRTGHGHDSELSGGASGASAAAAGSAPGRAGSSTGMQPAHTMAAAGNRDSSNTSDSGVSTGHTAGTGSGHNQGLHGPGMPLARRGRVSSADALNIMSGSNVSVSEALQRAAAAATSSHTGPAPAPLAARLRDGTAQAVPAVASAGGTATAASTLPPSTTTSPLQLGSPGPLASRLMRPAVTAWKDVTIFVVDDLDAVRPRFSTRVQRSIRTAIDVAARTLTGKYGCAGVVRLPLPELRDAFDLWSAVLTSADAPSFQEMLAESGYGGTVDAGVELFLWCLGLSRSTLPALLLALIEDLPAKLAPGRVRRLVEQCDSLKRRLNETLASTNGVLLMPVHPTTAPLHDVPLSRPFNVAYTQLFNALLLPATSVPMGLDSDGMPVALQIVGAAGFDRLTIACGQALEHAGVAGWVPPSAVSDCARCRFDGAATRNGSAAGGGGGASSHLQAALLPSASFAAGPSQPPDGSASGAAPAPAALSAAAVRSPLGGALASAATRATATT